ncbi:hypothetical protein OFY17_05115 [Marinomonas sp. C2222]|uniref:Uncharacterized protein n=1 Tax=Marinomonas sargassi TaxID=2984494 RepID=A0ABT2YQU8_9GAMM|nr:hypothetical protein [Marinomonas sargassi]MCV2402265.1 hypothetical protein [Marinomonas sargassi]
MELDFSQYTLGELYEAHEYIDAKAYPERLAEIERQIRKRESESFHSFSSDENGVSLTINRASNDTFNVAIHVTYNFLIFYQKNGLVICLTTQELKHLIHCLEKGIESKHGSSNIWGADQIIVKNRKRPANYCAIKIHHRLFVFGFFTVPATLSGKAIAALKGIVDEL